ncbi:His-Xaa-Ser system radical SAM maturase HxsC [Tissierella sp.]|uniref:His-Xaa-Ser system radical SAM maturase HxsC n=1 Tax=Tissierella sp. TaxID=41274 RepID=UPI0028ACDB31|nr:His-Xaa-Ser system radical SAM maturase HxsC [Tissierella sp.]
MNDLRVIKEEVLYITNKCNSNCIMCPDSESRRRKNIGLTVDDILEQIDEYPEDLEFVCITGGEPTLIRYDLIRVLRKCRDRFKNTDFLLLTNGRSFSDSKYSLEFYEAIPRFLMVGIPIYHFSEEGHDSITQSRGSFVQAVKGIDNLLSLNISIEIRVVVMKMNYKILKEIANFISERFKDIKRVNIMSLEVMGSSFVNRSSVWVDLSEINAYLKEAVKILIKAGIQVQLYNFPLCYVEEDLWSLCQKSISIEKVKYSNDCYGCKGKEQCGGFFNSTYSVIKPKVYIIE